jgi:valyl-tRNA synthetase
MPEVSTPSEAEDSSTKLPKTFSPSSFEERWYRTWETEGRFQPSGPGGSPRFVMVIPPPNVTGRLHIGHAYGRTIEDILARWKRMQGHRVLWVPGTDHAGIATQLVIDRQLARQGVDRRELGREKFIERVWAWKVEAKDTIQSQLKRLGCSLDWTRERFTMDPDLSRAVRHAFVRLYADGLIYRGRYVVNWCPGCRTAVSDLEVVEKKTRGTLYKIRYDVPGVPSGAIVATTRPETMLGDTALAIHPEDARNAKLRGKKAVLPIVGRELPIVEDAILVDREFGTGVVKVTPAHDANDFAVGQRHKLPSVVVIGPDGKMTAEAGEYAGLDRFEARKQIVERLEKEGRLTSEPYEINLGTCQRSEDIIEPYLSEQWFVKVAALAGPAIEAVEKGRIRFAPENWNKSYFSWMRGIRDWCISRQLWWGHRIPAFTCANGHVTVADLDPASCPTCGLKELQQDPDVLDTWFSSQLWPFSVFGWPDETKDLAEFYPTDVLVTGYDILFFWVARMIMAGLYFTKTEPFHTVHLHGLVRVGGEKMSKTRGNVIDPLEAIGEFGADAVRFALASAAAAGNTVAIEKGRMAGSRNFATKLWNAARFTLAQIEGKALPHILEGRSLSLPDRWILARLSATAADVDRHLSAFRLDEAAQAIYAFVWNDLCDGYLEMVKPVLSGKDSSEAAADTARGVLRRCLVDSLALLHPFMPFVTEEIWDKLTGKPGTLIVTPYPKAQAGWADPAAEAAVGAMRDIVTRVRNFRGERGASPTEPVELSIAPESPAAALLPDLEVLGPHLTHLARLSELRFAAPGARAIPSDKPVALTGAEGTGVVGDVVAGLLLGLSIARPGAEADSGKIAKTLAELDEEIAGLSAKLRNLSFVEKAPAAVVEKTRRRLLELEQRRRALSGSQA